METIINEAQKFFRAAYVEEITDRLNEKAADGELDSVVDAGVIEGDLLNVCDEAAFAATQQHYAWRIGEDELREALARPEIFEGIDYDALIQSAKKAN